MRLMRICSNYPKYLQSFYQSTPHLKDEPYAIQYQKLMEDCYGWANFWTIALAPLGYTCWEPVGNAEYQQKKWAHENNIEYDENSWLMDITLSQICDFKPDILFINDYCTYSPQFINLARRRCKSIRLVVGWCGAPFQSEDLFKAYDIILTNIPDFQKKFKKAGHNSILFRHAFANAVLEKIDGAKEKNTAISFIGSIVANKGFHSQRKILITELLEKTPLKIWSNDSAVFEGLDCQKNNGKHKNPGLFGLKMYQQLLRSNIVLNTHIDISEKSANNMRLFEVTGVGSCLLTDYKEDLADLFEADKEVVTYNSAAEAKEKIDHLLSNENLMQEIAKAGQERTLREHTFDHRAEYLNDIVLTHLN
jgi:hypothetical protein